MLNLRPHFLRVPSSIKRGDYIKKRGYYKKKFKPYLYQLESFKKLQVPFFVDDLLSDNVIALMWSFYG